MSGRRVVELVGLHRAMLSAVLITAVVVGLVALFVRRPEPPRVVVQQPATRAVASPPLPALLVVHLSGEVIMPGVYQLPVGARIDDALKAAGGPTDSGDIQRLNLAARLADGQQIAVPKRISPVLASFSASPSPTPGRINLNIAGVAELDQLPGVGPVTAQRIVAYREQHGPFTRIEQLREAKLINAPTFEKIKELVTV